MSRLDNINISPTYQVEIPSTQEKVKFRAYNVKEEKLLLSADQSEDGIVMINTLYEIVLNCLTPKPKRLTSFDLEYLFSQIRAKSVGEIANLIVTCDVLGCEEVKVEYRYDLRDIKVVFPNDKETFIKLSDELGVQMTYPSIEDSIEIEKIKDETEKKHLAIRSCISHIYSKEEVIDVSEESKESLSNFVDRLLPEQYRKLETFFDSFPVVSGKLKYRCPNCKKEHSKTIKGLANFFS